MGLDTRYHTPNLPPLVFITPWAPQALSLTLPRPNRSLPPLAGGSLLVPPILSLLGSIFGSECQTAPSSRSPGCSTPRLATSLFPAPYRFTPPPAGGSPLVPP